MTYKNLSTRYLIQQSSLGNLNAKYHLANRYLFVFKNYRRTHHRQGVRLLGDLILKGYTAAQFKLADFYHLVSDGEIHISSQTKTSLSKTLNRLRSRRDEGCPHAKAFFHLLEQREILPYLQNKEKIRASGAVESL